MSSRRWLQMAVRTMEGLPQNKSLRFSPPLSQRLLQWRRRGASFGQRRYGCRFWSIGRWRRRCWRRSLSVSGRRGRGRRRQIRPTSRTTIGCLHLGWNLVPLGIHTLLVSIVVAPLDFVTGTRSLSCPQKRTTKKTGPRSDSSIRAHIS